MKLNYLLVLITILISNCSYIQKEISVKSEFIKSYENGIAELKNDIPDGEYFVVVNYDCEKKDTLIIGSVENGKRNGKWYYYQTYGQIYTPCGDSYKELISIDTYKEGNIITSEYHTGSAIIETFYQKNQQYHNGDKLKINYNYSNGRNMIDTFLSEDNLIRYEFGSNKKLETKTRMINDTHLVKKYYLNGRLSGEYKIVLNRKRGIELFDGLARTWDEEGRLTKDIEYNMEEPESQKNN